MNTNAPSSSVHFGHQGRVVIVTGGAQGIGEACARRFAREEAKVVIADVADIAGRALAREIGASYVHCDVGDKLDVDEVVERTVGAHGRIDVLVNNAGIFKAADFLDITEDDFDAVLRVNLKGAFLMGQAVARAMARSGVVTPITASANTHTKPTSRWRAYRTVSPRERQLETTGLCLP